MIGNLEYTLLQQLWWLISSVVGSLFLMLTFVQGGQTLIFTTARNEEEKSLIVNAMGRKWELTFTTLVLFGGALFAAFPLFYATSFGGAYWVWMLILFTFIMQAVSYEYRKKPDNVLGARTYEIFMFINGSVGLLLIGAAVGRGDNSLEQRVEPCVAGAADWQPAAVGEHCHAVLAFVLIDAHQPRQVEQIRAVDSHERRWVE